MLNGLSTTRVACLSKPLKSYPTGIWEEFHSYDHELGVTRRSHYFAAYACCSFQLPPTQARVSLTETTQGSLFHHTIIFPIEHNGNVLQLCVYSNMSSMHGPVTSDSTQPTAWLLWHLSMLTIWSLTGDRYSIPACIMSSLHIPVTSDPCRQPTAWLLCHLSVLIIWSLTGDQHSIPACIMSVLQGPVTSDTRQPTAQPTAWLLCHLFM